jgi:hypothetical protein
MKKKITVLTLCAMLFALSASAQAQQLKVYRVGVVTAGGAWYEVIDGAQGRSQAAGV